MRNGLMTTLPWPFSGEVARTSSRGLAPLRNRERRDFASTGWLVISSRPQARTHRSSDTSTEVSCAPCRLLPLMRPLR